MDSSCGFEPGFEYTQLYKKYRFSFAGHYFIPVPPILQKAAAFTCFFLIVRSRHSKRKHTCRLIAGFGIYAMLHDYSLQIHICSGIFFKGFFIQCFGQEQII